MKNKYSLTQFPKLTPLGAWSKHFDLDPFFDCCLELSEKRKSLTPATNVKETDQCYFISIDLPGINEKNINIQFEDGNILSVSGKREEEIKKEDTNFTHLEKAYGEFYRSFQLSSNIDQESIQARYEKGVLDVLVPKTKKKNHSAIKIETQNGKTKEAFKKYLSN